MELAYDPSSAPLSMPVACLDLTLRAARPLHARPGGEGRNPGDLLNKSFKAWLIDETCRGDGCGFVAGAPICARPGHCAVELLLAGRSPWDSGQSLPPAIRLLSPALWRGRPVAAFDVRAVLIGRRPVAAIDDVEAMLAAWARRGLDVGGARHALEPLAVGRRLYADGLASAGDAADMARQRILLRSASPLILPRGASAPALPHLLSRMAERLAEADLAERLLLWGEGSDPRIGGAVREAVERMAAEVDVLDEESVPWSAGGRRGSVSHEGRYNREGLRWALEADVPAALMPWLRMAVWRGLGAQTGSGFGDVRMWVDGEQWIGDDA